MEMPPHFAERLCSRRRALAWLGGGLALCFGSPLEAAWKLIHINGNEYVTAENIKEFYRFAKLERNGNTVILRSPKLFMRLRGGSEEMYVNGVKFMLSLPAVSHGKDVLVSRIDLSKLIDPVLRPRHIANAELFSTVVIDPGHGGHDGGARGVYGQEKFYALDVGLRLARLLQKRGLKVVMTRTTDVYPTLPKRVEIANSTPNSIFISIHFNHSTSSAAQGIETYALAPQGTLRSRKNESETDAQRFQGNLRDSENIALATAVHAALLQHCRAVDRGIMRDRWFVLKGIERPGILVECGFVSNPVECAYINDPAYRERLAIGIGSGIITYRNALRR